MSFYEKKIEKHFCYCRSPQQLLICKSTLPKARHAISPSGIDYKPTSESPSWGMHPIKKSKHETTYVGQNIGVYFCHLLNFYISCNFCSFKI